MSLAGRGLGALAALALAATGCGGGEPVEGSGYAYDVPEGWEEASEERVSEIAPLADTIVFGEESDGFATNINVVATGQVPEGTDLLTEVELGITTVQEQPEIFGLPEETEIEVTMEPAETTLAGETAFEDQYTTDTGSQMLLQRQVTSISPDGLAFTITATSIGDAADRDMAMDEVLESWSWE